MMEISKFMKQAIDLARENVKIKHGRPFGAVIVKHGEVIATGVNDILETHDPTAHAEIQAIRKASQYLQTAQLTGCELYASGQPCPMCLSAIHLSGVKAVYFAYSNEQATEFGLSTAHLYEQMALPIEKQSLLIRQIENTTDSEHPYELWDNIKRVK
ncbi:cytidine deaminase [Domibacillus aminovorans]|uniref:Cytidine deaminase n=2 Tax=Bacillales TaxID=1385 RepID=A0A177KZS7_9BACI|nr:cytidine deaminase [Domibacillus aminovorans]